MRIYPRYKLRLPFRGEDHVYRLIEGLPDDGFAIHSLNLPEHEYKRWGEIDFILVQPSGITVLEVKGGSVSFADRRWSYRNARGQSILSTEGPARQALTATVALERMVQKKLGRKVHCRWGVVFPLCRFVQEVMELPAERRADLSACADPSVFARWLQCLPCHPHSQAECALTEDEMRLAEGLLVPKFHATESLGLLATSINARSIELTEQQYEVLESVEATPRLVITGGGGTGKTELAVAVARAEKAAGRRPCLVVPESPLAHRLVLRLSGTDIPVCRGGLPAGCDTLVVDEGQDFVHPEAMEMLSSSLPGGLEHGRWRWFMDPNLQFLGRPPEPTCLARLQSVATQVTLKRNVRNTKDMVECVRALLQVDLGLASVDGFGVRVPIHRVRSPEEEYERVVGIIETAVADGVAPSEIAVIGPRGTRGAVCSRLVRERERLTCSLELHATPRHRERVAVASIADFRGIESPVVVLADLDLLPEGDRGRVLLYIAMTRATVMLHLVLSDGVQQRLGNLVCM